MTADERLVLQTTIILHGFELYERFMNDGVWRPLLVGKPAGMNQQQPLFEMIETWIKDDRIADRRGRCAISSKWQRMHWFELTDQQLVEFHRTVVSTC